MKLMIKIVATLLVAFNTIWTFLDYGMSASLWTYSQTDRNNLIKLLIIIWLSIVLIIFQWVLNKPVVIRVLYYLVGIITLVLIGMSYIYHAPLISQGVIGLIGIALILIAYYLNRNPESQRF